MEMSLAYMEETVRFLEGKGFSVTRSRGTLTDEMGSEAQTHLFALRRGAEEQLLLETICYADAGVRYFLAIERYYQMRSYSFPLDSWRFKQESIEFKYYAPAETGVGLSFHLNLARPPAPG